METISHLYFIKMSSSTIVGAIHIISLMCSFLSVTSEHSQNQWGISQQEKSLWFVFHQCQWMAHVHTPAAGSSASFIGGMFVVEFLERLFSYQTSCAICGVGQHRLICAKLVRFAGHSDSYFSQSETSCCCVECCYVHFNLKHTEKIHAS